MSRSCVDIYKYKEALIKQLFSVCLRRRWLKWENNIQNKGRPYTERSQALLRTQAMWVEVKKMGTGSCSYCCWSSKMRAAWTMNDLKCLSFNSCENAYHPCSSSLCPLTSHCLSALPILGTERSSCKPLAPNHLLPLWPLMRQLKWTCWLSFEDLCSNENNLWFFFLLDVYVCVFHVEWYYHKMTYCLILPDAQRKN